LSALAARPLDRKAEYNMSEDQKIRVIPLILCPSLKETGIVKSFDISRSKKSISIVITLNGRYDNKTVICDFDRKSWGHSQKNMNEALKFKGIDNEHMRMLSDTLDDNHVRVNTYLDSLDEEEKDDEIIRKESTKVLQLIDELELITELFHDQVGNAFATVYVDSELVIVDSHLETLPIHSSKFERWVCRLYYKHRQRTLGGETLKEICMNLGSKAEWDGQERYLDIRVNKDKGKPLTIYYDLVNTKWEIVEVTPNNWSIKKHATEAPTLFRRYPSLVAQVYPAESKSYPPDIFDQFFSLINIKDVDDVKLLLKCYIISLFIPEISKVVLIVHGSQGAAKTAFQWLIKLLVDPCPGKLGKPSLLSPPTTKEDFRQQMLHNYVVYYDNTRYVKYWLSDCLCRASTGTFDSKRALYTNDDDFMYEFLRPAGLNGVNLTANQADLLDRSILVQLMRIDPKKRRDFEEEIMAAFEKLRPQLLAYIFDILVKVLRMKKEGGIKLNEKNRMADWEIWAEMISRSMGYKPKRFVKAYNANRKLAVGQVLETSPIAAVVIGLMENLEEGQFRWEGTYTELLGRLEEIAVILNINSARDKNWPKAAHVLSAKLNEIKVDLADVGIIISERKHSGATPRKITIEKEAPKPPKPSKSADGGDKKG
jgi:hypothetical protein